jgi:CHAD domain-containing protein
MRSDAWPQYCRAALVRSVGAAAARFPDPGEEAPKRVHDVRKTLKEARAIARLFLDCVGEPARVTMTTLAATRRQIGRTRDLDVMALRVQRLERASKQLPAGPVAAFPPAPRALDLTRSSDVSRGGT